MNYQKYFQDLLHYHYMQGDCEELGELIFIAA